ncbi:MAG: hypothetical protein ABSD27_02305 [Bryobacteraceae bacterium]
MRSVSYQLPPFHRHDGIEGLVVGVGRNHLNVLVGRATQIDIDNVAHSQKRGQLTRAA